MADMTDLGFDSQQVEPTSFEVLPAGDYLVIITDSARKPTANGNGERLAMTAEIIDGPMKGRKLFPGFNIANKNPEAVRISLGELSALSRAVGIGKLSDSAQLHNLPFTVTVGVRHNKETKETENVIKAYKPKSGGVKSPTAGPTQGSSPPGGAPWHR